MKTTRIMPLAIILALTGSYLTTTHAATSDVYPNGMTKEETDELVKCFSNMDPDALDSFELGVKKMEQEVRQLCADDKRDEADKLALNYKQKITESNEIQSIKQCGDISNKILAGVPLIDHSEQPEDGESPHICDQN